MKIKNYSPEHWFVEIMGLLFLIIVLPLWPLILVIISIIKYTQLNDWTRNPFKIFLFTFASMRNVALIEYDQYRNKQGEEWEKITELWMPWSYKIKYPLLIAHCFVLLILTSFISEKITKDIDVDEIAKMYL